MGRANAAANVLNYKNPAPCRFQCCGCTFRRCTGGRKETASIHTCTMRRCECAARPERRPRAAPPCVRAFFVILLEFLSCNGSQAFHCNSRFHAENARSPEHRRVPSESHRSPGIMNGRRPESGAFGQLGRGRSIWPEVVHLCA